MQFHPLGVRVSPRIGRRLACATIGASHFVETVMHVGAFYLPSLGRKEEIVQGMAGKRTDLYQRMLAELTR